MKNRELYPNLEDVFKWASLEQIVKLLYLLGQVRYATKNQIYNYNHRLSGKPKLVRLEEENLIACKNGIYTLTRAGRDFLKENDRNIRHFQEITEAEKCEHEIKNYKLSY